MPGEREQDRKQEPQPALREPLIVPERDKSPIANRASRGRDDQGDANLEAFPNGSVTRARIKRDGTCAILSGELVVAWNV